MTQTQTASAEALENAHRLVGAVVSILEKLHSEGFIATKVYPNLGLSKVKSVLQETPDVARIYALEAFVRQIADLFESKQLLHPSATEKFQTLFAGYLASSLDACAKVTESGTDGHPGATLH